MRCRLQPRAARGCEGLHAGVRGWRVEVGVSRVVLQESCLPPTDPRYPSELPASIRPHSWMDASIWHLLRACVLNLEPCVYLVGLFSGSCSPFCCPTHWDQDPP